jgi:hypothetical protein
MPFDQIYRAVRDPPGPRTVRTSVYLLTELPMHTRIIGAATLAALSTLPVIAGCGADLPTEAAQNTRSTSLAVSAGMPGDPGAASDRLFYRVQLDPMGDHQARGMVFVEVVGGYLRVRTHGVGVAAGERIPQHIHRNVGCADGGGILINLDENLTVAGEGPGVGAAYPRANEGGVLNYEATRSLEDLRAAVNYWYVQNLATDAELLDFLDLENRNVHMHVAFGPPYPAVNCGEL